MAAVSSARYSVPRDYFPVESSTNLDKTIQGRRDSNLPQSGRAPTPATDMSNHLNAQATPFLPHGFNDDRYRNPYGLADAPIQPPPPPPPPFPPQDARWQENFPPPLPPPQAFFNQHAYNNGFANHGPPPPQQQGFQRQQWNPPPPGPPPYGSPGYQHGFQPGFGPGFGPHGHPNMHNMHGANMPGRPPMFAPQQQPRRDFSNQAYQYGAMREQANFRGGLPSPADIQYAFDALIKDFKSRQNHTNSHSRASTPPSRMNNSGLAADTQAKQQKDASKASKKKGRYGDNKIMLPAPQPTDDYLNQAAETPVPADTPNRLLVILDLNGTVLYRPNRNAQTMIARPYLAPFVRYLFENFNVMIWSSARPDNVKALVQQSLDDDLRSRLVAQWARDSFGLSPANYQQNVQVYKNLKLIWSRNQIQDSHPGYEAGERFGQHNTVLIDDSAIKAAAQPHNLIEIPEFMATPEQMDCSDGDVLREVAGYLEALRHQTDVSKFIHKQPFELGQWSFDWGAEPAGGGELTGKVSMGGPGGQPKAGKKKNKKRTKANAGNQGPAVPEGVYGNMNGP